MKILLSGLFMASLTFSSIAQKAPIKFGDISLEDLKMQKYDKDSSAAAVILTDYGTSSIIYHHDVGFSLTFERIIRIKILSKEGLDWATFSVPLYHEGSSDEKLSGLRGVTYNLENNKIVESKLKGDGTFKEKASENFDIVKFTLPNAKEGSVLEVTYSVNSDFMMNFQDWEFQSTIPTRWSEYRARIPEYFYYERYMQGYVPLTLNESTNGMGSITSLSGSASNRIEYIENNFRWAAKDVPAFKEEPYMTTTKDFISKIQFELSYQKFPNQPLKTVMGTWEDINTKYAESSYFGEKITGNNFLGKITDEVIAVSKTEEEKIAAICNYVKNNVEWNGHSTKVPYTSFKKVLEEKKGTSAEINMLMGSMLEKAGISVSPVLISTRDHGFIRESAPISSQFNYVLCLVKTGGKNYLLDATDRLLATGVLPERCLNGNGFVVSKGGFSWIPLKTNTRSRHAYTADLKLNSAGELKGKLQLDRSGYYASADRKSYIRKGEGDYVKDFVGDRSWTVDKSEFINTKEISEVFKEVHEVTINDHVVTTDALMYLNPFLGYNEKENPFKSEKREYPVDFGSPKEKIYIAKIAIPDGYTVDEMPQSKVLSVPGNGARYTYSITQTGTMLSVTSQLVINNSLFTQNDYPYLREFYSQVVAKQSEQIVLKKK